MFELKMQRRSLPWHAIVFTAILVLFSIAWSVQSVSADDAEVVGWVEVMPAEGLIGTWEVDGFAFVTTRVTEFQQERGEFAVGQCVEVEYVMVAEQTLATKLATKRADDCGNGETPTATPGVTVTPAPSDDDGHDDEQENERVRAIVEALPEDGFRGVWTVGGVQYQVNGETRIRQKEGPIRAGTCVEIRYRMDAEPYPALRIESESRRKCHGASPTPGGTIPAPTETPEPSSTPDDDSEIYGILESFPVELIGEWVIAGTPYTATANTEFEAERGEFAVGVCVKAHLASADNRLIREVETTNRFRCGGSDDDKDDVQARGELYGMVQELPSDLIGDWQIGGLTIKADTATEFNERRSEFAEGVIVKVHFLLLTQGIFYATEIEAKFANDDHGDDDHNDVYEGAEGHAYGLLESFPTDRLGEWSVAGISYTVTSETHFVRPHSNFEVGVMVRVKYRTDVDGNRIARQIKTTSDNGGASGEGHATLFGYVDQMPVSGFAGEWVVDGVTFHANGTTKFKEEHGLLSLGSYVKMEYFTSDGRNVLHEIESQVPPGAGDDTTVGEIEAIGDETGDSTASSASVRMVDGAVWMIGGQEYIITAATDLNDFQGELTVGSTVTVNSYTADDGSIVATQVRGVTLVNTIFLPTINR